MASWEIWSITFNLRYVATAFKVDKEYAHFEHNMLSIQGAAH